MWCTINRIDKGKRIILVGGSPKIGCHNCFKPENNKHKIDKLDLENTWETMQKIFPKVIYWLNAWFPQPTQKTVNAHYIMHDFLAFLK